MLDEEDRHKIEKENDVLKTIISEVAGKAEHVSPTRLAVVEKTADSNFVRAIRHPAAAS